ncbi:MAG TPA: hypothetical protein PLS28_03835, partial [Clostridiales bacterium]|nr:hypothetical protein [Clostridiales bacterium]
MAEERNKSVEEIMAEIMAHAEAQVKGSHVAKAGWSMDEIDALLAEQEQSTSYSSEEEETFRAEDYNRYMPEVEELFENIPVPTDPYPVTSFSEKHEAEEVATEAAEAATEAAKAERRSSEEEEDAISFVSPEEKEENVKTYHRADHTKTAPLELGIVEVEPETESSYAEEPYPQERYTERSQEAYPAGRYTEDLQEDYPAERYTEEFQGDYPKERDTTESAESYPEQLDMEALQGTYSEDIYSSSTYSAEAGPSDEYAEEASAEVPSGDGMDDSHYSATDYTTSDDEAFPDEEAFGYEEEAEEAEPEKRAGFFGNLKRSLKDFLQGGYEDDDTYDEEEDAAEEEVPVQRVTGKEAFTEAGSQKTKVFQNPEALKGTDPEGKGSHQMHLQGELSKGVDENPDSPKMIMELADENADRDRRYEKKALADKTVGIHPIHNENIPHQIVPGKVEHSGGMVSDKYRERFMRRPEQKLETTAEHEALHQGDAPSQVERPGFLLKKSKFSNTADLEPVPTIIAADADLTTFDQTIVAKGSAPTIAHEDVEIDGQIKLVGFDDLEREEPEQVDEENAEEALREKRHQKIAEFRLNPDFAEQELPEEPSTEEAFSDMGTPSVRPRRR